MKDCLCEQVQTKKGYLSIKCICCNREFREAKTGTFFKVDEHTQLTRYHCEDEKCIEYTLGLWLVGEMRVILSIDSDECNTYECNKQIYHCYRCWHKKVIEKKEEIYCKGCTEYRENVKPCTREALKDIQSNGYNTFGDVINI